MTAVKKSSCHIGKRSIFVLLFFTIIIFSYFIIKSENFLTNQTEAPDASEVLPEILSGDEYSQEITCREDGLQAVSLDFATYSRLNASRINITLTDGENRILQKWDLDCRRLNDSEYYTLKLDHRISSSKNKTYYLKITSDAAAGSGVTVYCNSDTNSKGLSLNGTSLKKTLCCQLTYRYPYAYLFSKVNGFHTIMTLILALLFILSIPIVSKLSIENTFLIFWLLLSTTYFFSAVMLRAPDEAAHFFRSYGISYQHFVSDIDENTGSGGCELPLDVDLTLLTKNWQSFSEHKDLQVSNNFVFESFTSLSLYSPFSYIPQAAGIFIARHLTKNIAVIVYTARLFTWLLITLILYAAIKMIPAGKGILALIAFIPMNMYESVSLSPDGIVVAVSCLIIAFVLYLRCVQKKKLSVAQYVLLYFLALMIGQLKIVYLPFCLLYFLIPAERFGSKKMKYLHLSLMAILVVGTSLLWLSLCSKFLIKNGTDASVQVHYVLQHPLQYIFTILRTVFSDSSIWGEMMIGQYLGAFEVATVGILVFAYLCLLVCKFTEHPVHYSSGRILENGLFGFIVLSTALLIFTSLYVQWSSPYNNTVQGVQGRYFIALILPFYFAIHNPSGLFEVNGSKEKLSVGVSSFIGCINICSCMALLFSYLT